jgi:hypothetical protein
MELVRSSLSIVIGLPCVTVRSAPAIIVSGPARRSLTLWPARSRSRLATLSIESSDSFVASAAASIATGWSEPVPGRELHPLKSSAFHGALFHQLRPSAKTSVAHFLCAVSNKPGWKCTRGILNAPPPLVPSQRPIVVEAWDHPSEGGKRESVFTGPRWGSWVWGLLHGRRSVWRDSLLFNDN